MEITMTDYMLCGMIEKLVKDDPELLECFYKVSEIDQSFSIGYDKADGEARLYCERAEQMTLDAAGQKELEEFCIQEAQKQEEDRQRKWNIYARRPPMKLPVTRQTNITVCPNCGNEIHGQTQCYWCGQRFRCCNGQTITKDADIYICRGKNPIKDWVYGNIFVRPESQLSFGNSRQMFILAEDGCCYEVDPMTVGRYTGMTDKTGRKVFEDDIVEKPCEDSIYPDEVWRGEIIWEHYRWLVATNRGFSPMTESISNGTIIGNIHDNPDLIL